MDRVQKTKKKILFLITKSNWGGAQRYVHDLASALDPHQYDIAVALGGDGELKDKLAEADIRTITLQSLQRDISLTKELRFTLELWKLLRTERADILHVNSSKAGGLGCLIGRLTFTPHVIFTAHGWAFNEQRPGWQKIIIKFLHWLTVILSHTTIAVSYETKRQLNLPLPTKRWSVIHNGRHKVDFLSKTEARNYLNLRQDALISGTIGELHPIKQHHLMIQVVAELRQKGCEITHVIIGAGEQESELHALAQTLEVSDRVIFAGAVDEAARYLKAFDIYVQPSRSEALAYTLIEAAQAGLPIVASNVGGIPEIIIDGNNGLLLPYDDMEQFATCIHNLATNPTLRSELGQNATQTSKAFSFAEMLKKTTAVYESRTTSSARAEARATD